jgi:hypothetical protein
MLINNEFVFLPIPKNASTAVIYSIVKWKIPTDFGSTSLNEWTESQIKSSVHFDHKHFSISFYKKVFPQKKVIAIRRNSVDRFISALKYMMYQTKLNKINLKHDFENLSEDEIIEVFSSIFFELNKLNFYSSNEMHPEYNNQFAIVAKKYITDDTNFNLMWFLNFTSQYFWGLNECDIVFDIKNLNEFESFIKIIKPSFNLIKMNSANDIISLNLNKTEKLNSFVNDLIDYKWSQKN